MGVLIRDLPDHIRTIAEIRQREANWNSYSEELIDCFDWSSSPEGFSYWSNVNRGNYDATPMEEDDQILK